MLKQNIILSVVLGVGDFYICSCNEYKVVVVKIKNKNTPEQLANIDGWCGFLYRNHFKMTGGQRCW
ncbi:hypothetical protein [Aeromonas sp. L_1B5_3]|uniref:hypothetical protein n=1 Tax=Aeromonas sp. L_1B5_3 TaxID=1588629 RepID=UPI0012E00CD1|nr:hypothetical protein [Aeromonas sp. L_1B5_3]